MKISFTVAGLLRSVISDQTI